MTAFKPGDEVYGYIRRHHLQFGTYAEYATATDTYFAHKPASLSFEEAAALPLVGLTAHQALETMGVRGGETLFIGGGSGGVGHIAVQLGVARGARVIATASERNQDFLRELGAEPLDYARGRHPRARARDHRRRRRRRRARPVRRRRPRGGVRGAAPRRPLRLGRRSRRPEPRDGYEVHYVFVRPDGDELRELAELVQGGQLRPHVEEVFPLERAAEAHERVEGGHVRGKLVLSVPA